MAVQHAEIDRQRISGGSDAWDQLQGSVVLLDDYFSQASFSQILDLPLITDSNTLYEPTVALVQNLVLPHITDGDNLYAPVITPPSPLLTLPFISSTSTLNTPTIELPALEIVLPTIVGHNLFAPTVTTETSLTLPIINNETVLYEPSVDFIVTLPFIASIEDLYPPTLEVQATTISLPFLINEEQMNRFLLTRQEKRWTGLSWVD